MREIKRITCRKFNSEEKIRIIIEGLKGKDSIAAIRRREGIVHSLYYKWGKSFLEASKHIKSCISGVFNRAVDDDLILSNPVSDWVKSTAQNRLIAMSISYPVKN